MVNPTAFGSLLRRHRLAAGLTQEELAERAFLSAREVSDLERGVRRAPYPGTRKQLADALGLSPEDRVSFDAAARSKGADTGRAPSGILPRGGFLGAAPTTQLVAREEETARLRAVADTVTRGEGRLILLAGEPGIGKTRLAQEMAGLLPEQGFLVATGTCYESRSAVPYYPFLDVLASLYQAIPEDVRADLLTRRPALGPLLSGAGVIVADEEQQQERLLRAMAGFVADLAQESPVAILLDDLHWADSATLLLLHHLARATRGCRVLLLGTYRDVEVGRQRPLERALRDLQHDGLLERFPVLRLTREGTTALLTTALGEEEIARELAAIVYRHTDGNPFFTHEVLHTLIERGDVYRRDGRWERKAIEEIVIPESIRSAMGERLSRLSEEAQELLREASVLGVTFGFDELHVMSGCDEQQVEDLLEEAGAAGMVREMGRGYYGFVHGLIQGVLYGELSGRRRRRLHLAAGAALERLPEHTRSIRAAELAWHFLEGDDPEKALTYSLLAANQAVHIGTAAELEQHATMALQLARELGDRERETQALAYLLHLQTTSGRYAEAERILQEVGPVLDKQGDVQTVVGILCGMGHTAMARGHLQESKDYFERAVRLDAGGDLGLLAVSGLEWISRYLGDWDEAGRLAAEIKERGQRERGEAGIWGLLLLGRLAMLQGEWEEAERLLQECVHQGTDMLHRIEGPVGNALFLLAEVEVALGHAPQDLERLAAILDAPDFPGEDRMELLPLLARLYETAGDDQQALRRATEAVEESRDAGYVPALMEALVVYGGILLLYRRRDEVRAALEEALGMARDMPCPYQEAKALLALGALHRELGEEQEAGCRIDAALATFRRLGARPDIQRAERMLTQLSP